MSNYTTVYPLVKELSAEDDKVKTAIMTFKANQQIKLNDLLDVLYNMNSDSGRAHVVKRLRNSLKTYAHFDRMEIIATFTHLSKVPPFLYA